MNYTEKALNQLALCLGRCTTCSETMRCVLKTKVQQTDTNELDGIIYDALAKYYDRLYGVSI